MRILYGAVGEGLGHATRSGVVAQSSARPGSWRRMTSPPRIWRSALRMITSAVTPLLQSQSGCDVAMGHGRGQSIEVTERILARWRAEGMRFVTIPELIEATGYAVEPYGCETARA